MHFLLTVDFVKSYQRGNKASLQDAKKLSV